MTDESPAKDDPKPAPTGRGRLVLEYIRTLIWPILVGVAVVFFSSDISTLLREREIQIGDLKFGSRIEEISEITTEELEEIRQSVAELIARSEDPEIRQAAEKIDQRLENLAANLDEEVDELREDVLETQAGGVEEHSQSEEDDASRLEEEGFAYLAERDLEGALTSFKGARDAWPEYHNVSEIYRLLNSRESDLKEGSEEARQQAWEDVLRKILEEYSWGMNDQESRKLRQAQAASGSR